MSRLPLPTSCSPTSEVTNHIMMMELSTSSVTFEDVQMHSKKDAIISRVIDFVLTRETSLYLNCPPWLEKILKFTYVKWLKMHLNCPPWLEKILEYYHCIHRIAKKPLQNFK